VDSVFVLQPPGALQGSAANQGANSANDPLAALFAQALAQSLQAPNSAPAAQASGSGTSAIGAVTSSASASSISSDWTALSQALSSNNLSAAQLAFQTLQTDVQGIQTTHHRRHHHHASATQGLGATASTSGAGTAVPATTDIQSAAALPASTIQGSTAGNASLLSVLMGMA
jgi:hypothetical protein